MVDRRIARRRQIDDAIADIREGRAPRPARIADLVDRDDLTIEQLRMLRAELLRQHPDDRELRRLPLRADLACPMISLDEGEAMQRQPWMLRDDDHYRRARRAWRDSMKTEEVIDGNPSRAEDQLDRDPDAGADGRDRDRRPDPADRRRQR